MNRQLWAFCLVALGLALLLAALSPLASSSPDGLERVVEDHGPAPSGEQSAEGLAPMPDYKVPGVRSDALATILAGLAGTLVALGVALALGRLIASRRKEAVVEGEAVETPPSH